eukprot:3449963-Amphidinium_carterae.1
MSPSFPTTWVRRKRFFRKYHPKQNDRRSLQKLLLCKYMSCAPLTQWLSAATHKLLGPTGQLKVACK